MKRSEAIEKMKKCYQACKTMRYSDEQAMDRVLEVLEENGMLPPTYFGYSSIPVNKWEQDDKND